jgi:hypothetical protein
MQRKAVYVTPFEAALAISANAVDAPLYDVTDKRFFHLTVQMSRRFERLCGNRFFFPRRETRLYNHPRTSAMALKPIGNYSITPLAVSGDIDQLQLEDDLLHLETLTTQNGATTISSDDYWLKNIERWNDGPPWDRVELDANGAQKTFDYTTTWQQANSVDGIWGFHLYYDDAWQRVDSVQNNPLAVAGTSITVADADGVDENGLKPRFQVQQLLRLGDAETGEYVYVTDVNYSTNILTVTRAVNGTTGAEQPLNTSINLFRPQDDIRHAVTAYVAYAYRRWENIGTDADQPFAASGVIALPAQLPQEVTDAVSLYRRNIHGAGRGFIAA